MARSLLWIVFLTTANAFGAHGAPRMRDEFVLPAVSQRATAIRRVHHWESPLLSTSTTALKSSVAATTSEKESDDSSSVVSATFGLMKAILGSGCLALPAGLAAVSDFPSMLWPANVLLVVLGALSAYTFSLYGRLAHQTKGKNIGEIWQRVNGTDKSTLVSVANFVYCFGCCLTFSLVIGDSLSSLMQAGGLCGWLASRQTAILAVTGTTLLPLCNLKSLAALAPVSIVGVLGTLVATLFVAYRCPALVPTSPYAKASGRFLKSIPETMQPSFRTYNRLASPAPLVLVAMACVAWMAHFSAPEFYTSLTGSSPTEEKRKTAIASYQKMTIAGYSAVAVINAMALTFGFLTFGGNAAGIILNNYATADVGASLSRFLVTVSVTGGFPFLFGAFRSAALDLMGKPETDKNKSRMTLALLGLITAISLIIKDAGFVVSFNGALMGTAIIYIFPCLLFLKHTASRIASKSLRLERAFCRGLVGFGGVSAVVGAVTAVLNSYFPHMLR